MQTKQRIGIVCDDYKLEMFKEELAKAGIEIVSIGPMMNGVAIVTVFSFQPIIKPIVDKVTQHFIDKYRKEN